MGGGLGRQARDVGLDNLPTFRVELSPSKPPFACQGGHIWKLQRGWIPDEQEAIDFEGRSSNVWLLWRWKDWAFRYLGGLGARRRVRPSGG